MLVAVSSEPKLTFPSTVSRPDNVSKVEAASSFTSLGPTAAAGRTGRRDDRVTLPNVAGRGTAARRAQIAPRALGAAARTGAVSAGAAIAAAIALLGLGAARRYRARSRLTSLTSFPLGTSSTSEIPKGGFERAPR